MGLLPNWSWKGKATSKDETRLERRIDKFFEELDRAVVTDEPVHTCTDRCKDVGSKEYESCPVKYYVTPEDEEVATRGSDVAQALHFVSDHGDAANCECKKTKPDYVGECQYPGRMISFPDPAESFYVGLMDKASTTISECVPDIEPVLDGKCELDEVKIENSFDVPQSMLDSVKSIYEWLNKTPYPGPMWSNENGKLIRDEEKTMNSKMANAYHEISIGEFQPCSLPVPQWYALVGWSDCDIQAYGPYTTREGAEAWMGGYSQGMNDNVCDCDCDNDDCESNPTSWVIGVVSDISNMRVRVVAPPKWVK